MKTANRSIITLSASYVKTGETTPHTRHRHTDPDVREIPDEIRARARVRHVAHCVRKRRAVRVPAMSSSEWGQFLRSLEIHRAVA
jgi:hypothetical protein